MTIRKLDIDRSEQGVGASKLELVAGDPFNPTVARETGFTSDPIPIGESDGYDVSSATALRLYFDVALGGASFLILRAVPMAADPAPGGIPSPAGAPADSAMDPKVAVLDSNGVISLEDAGIRFNSDLRGAVTISRPSILTRFEVLTDGPTDLGAGIALAIQSLVDGGGE